MVGEVFNDLPGLQLQVGYSLRYLDAIAAICLCGVERLVGQLEQRFCVPNLRMEPDNSNTAGDGQLGIGGHGMFLTKLLLKVTNSVVTPFVKAGHHDEELFSAEASCMIVGPKIALQAAPEFTQHVVADKVPIGIVECLK